MPVGQWMAYSVCALLVVVSPVEGQNPRPEGCGLGSAQATSRQMATVCLDRADSAARFRDHASTEAAVTFARLGLRSAVQAGDLRLQVRAQLRISERFTHQLKIDSALTYAYRAHALSRSTRDSIGQVAALILLAQGYGRLGRSDSLFAVGAELLTLCPTDCGWRVPWAIAGARIAPDSVWNIVPRHRLRNAKRAGAPPCSRA